MEPAQRAHHHPWSRTAAKAIASVGVAVVTIPPAFGIGALGNRIGR